jgi:hypothetical protein
MWIVTAVEAEHLAGGPLRQPTLADLSGEKAHEPRLDHQLVRVGQFEFVKRAFRHFWLLSACRARSSASFSRAWTRSILPIEPQAPRDLLKIGRRRQMEA